MPIDFGPKLTKRGFSRILPGMDDPNMPGQISRFGAPGASLGEVSGLPGALGTLVTSPEDEIGGYGPGDVGGGSDSVIGNLIDKIIASREQMGQAVEPTIIDESQTPSTASGSVQTLSPTAPKVDVSPPKAPLEVSAANKTVEAPAVPAGGPKANVGEPAPVMPGAPGVGLPAATEPSIPAIEGGAALLPTTAGAPGPTPVSSSPLVGPGPIGGVGSSRSVIQGLINKIERDQEPRDRGFGRISEKFLVPEKKRKVRVEVGKGVKPEAGM